MNRGAMWIAGAIVVSAIGVAVVMHTDAQHQAQIAQQAAWGEEVQASQAQAHADDEARQQRFTAITGLSH